MRPIAVFSDFDGTITTQDTGTVIIDACMGYEERRKLDLEILHGTKTFREAVYQMWASCNISWSEAIALLQHVQLDPKWNDFYTYCQANSIPITVVSAGLKDLVGMFLKDYKVQVVANDIKIHPDFWEILYLDDSDFGHDKGSRLRLAKTLEPRPWIVFIGDGVSDLSAAQEADAVFCRRGKDLEKWCQMHGMEHQAFDDFGEIQAYLHSLDKV